jgi:nucleotide-binding universal stress UspA family protein
MTTPRSPFQRILVPTDFSAASEEAWRSAQQLARPLNAELVLLHVFVEAPLYSESPFSAQRVREVYASGRDWVQATLARWAGEARASGLTVRTEFRTGVPYKEIVAAAGEGQADLIVVGTHGRGGVERALLGSVADRVIRLAPCPVLSVGPTRSA